MSDTAAATATDLQAALRQKLRGYMETQLIHVAAQLEVMDILGESAKSSAEVARACSAHVPSVHRLMQGLTHMGLCVQHEDGRFSATPVGRQLRKDVPGSLWNNALLAGELFYLPFGELLHAVKTGKIAFDAAYGAGIFEHMQTRPEVRRHFDQHMVDLSTATAAAVVDAYDFGDARTVVDVAGGAGAVLAGILERHPQMTGSVFEIPQVQERAREFLKTRGVADRAKVVEGDFFTAIPAGADVYILSQILHDWDDERSLQILGNCRRAMSPSSRLLVLEAVMPERVEGPSFAVAADLFMLVLTGGRERTLAEYRTLFASAGFELARVIPTRSPNSVLEARPAR